METCDNCQMMKPELFEATPLSGIWICSDCLDREELNEGGS